MGKVGGAYRKWEGVCRGWGQHIGDWLVGGEGGSDADLFPCDGDAVGVGDSVRDQQTDSSDVIRVCSA